MGALPVIAITMGDPAGVGPELCCRVCADPAVTAACRPLVIGDPGLLERVAESLDLPRPPQVEAVAADGFDPAAVRPGHIAAANGAIAIAAVERAVAGCRSGAYAAVTTAPIHKQAIHRAGCPFPGHTELLAERCEGQAVMMLYDETVAVTLATVHCALRDVPTVLTTESVVAAGQRLAEALHRIRTAPPRIAVLGLNPHAGEGGLFGDEDERLVAPAVTRLQELGIDAEGPLPPDTAFTPEARDRYHGHVCCYHDQGLIPFKALAFERGVNVTLGLDIVRTSPDHGTAFDRAWRGTASAASLRSAVLLAARLA